MKFFILLTIFSSARAFGWGGGVNTFQEYSCLGLDGVPITTAALESTCCSNGNLIANAPDACRAGFNSISGDAAASAAYDVQLAQTALNDALQMNGVTTNLNNVSLTDSRAVPTAETSESSAITAPSTANAESTTAGSLSDADTAAKSANAANTGAGVGSGSAGGGSTTGGLSFSSNPTAATASKDAADAGSATNAKSGVSYASAGGSAGGVSGNGMSGLNDGSGGAVIAIETEGASLNANKNGNLADEDAGATADDPADYFKRTDQSANLFKIVSNRYLKKKSLWKVK